jgi:hypothetical protein
MKSIFVVCNIYAIFFLFIGMLLSWFTQSKFHPLTFCDFLLPNLISVIILIWGTIDLFVKKMTSTKIIIATIMLVPLESIAIRWQIEYVILAIANNWILAETVIPMIVCWMMTIYLFFSLVTRFWREKKVSRSMY